MLIPAVLVYAPVAAWLAVQFGSPIPTTLATKAAQAAAGLHHGIGHGHALGAAKGFGMVFFTGGDPVPSLIAVLIAICFGHRRAVIGRVSSASCVTAGRGSALPATTRLRPTGTTRGQS
ncbi:MAG: hypothetical protein HC794_02540 [Nitrospiraceae bacterium]|nr:hypothetical protein [Nitrospiraceae bacterium]